MRVTNKMMSNNFLRDMRNNLQNMQTLQQQMTSGKEIRRPSDNPFKTARAMQLHTDISTNKQYNENIKDTINWLDVTDTALDQAGNVLQRVRELLVSAGNAGYGPDEKKAIKDEINQKVGELTQVLNTNFDGKYLFAGSRGLTKPVMEVTVDGNNSIEYQLKDGTSTTDLTNEEVNMISHKLEVEVSQGVKLEYNISAKDVLQFSATKDLNSVLKNITTHLDGNSVGTEDPAEALNGEDLQDITDAINNLLRLRSEVGAKQNRMEGAKDKNVDENFNMTEILSETEDIDITEKTMQYATMQTVYVASLQTSAKVIQPTLMDYLR